MTINQDKKEIKGNLFDIQGLSVHDGPGCRTLIFFSGCTLDCIWCSNPEGISKEIMPLYFPSKCISCGNCIDDCIKEAIKKDENGIIINRDLCLSCEDKPCISACYTDALKLSGFEISTTELLRIIQRDRQFWGSEGGITLSGGEPLLQIDFAEEVLKNSHDSFIHTAIETCGNIPYKNFQRVIPYLDWIFFDLKHFDSEKHKIATGTNNSLIIENAKQLAQNFNGRLIFRLPLIPNFNDSIENINAIGLFLKEIGKNEINILPLHHLGREKYLAINKEYLGYNYPIPSSENMKRIKQQYADMGIICYLGEQTPF
ncbi:MAG: glycyl-radical enzyme activating protein [Bacteroidales bacterium]|nr:glycyl-radical enzyme activating protein [Bacteroidales bacterium]